MTEALVADLLCDSGTLAARLGNALRDEQWLDAYLFAAGLGQVVDDRLHPDPYLFHRAASYLRGLPSRPARLAGTVAGGLGAVTRADTQPTGRRLMRARRPLAELTLRLAGQVITPRPAGDLTPLLEASVPAVSLAGGDPLRLPACFHSFDQHPDDVRWLAGAFRDQYPERDTPLGIVGLRTSGSYLAPLHAAALRADGQARAEVLTYRPGRPFLRSERAALLDICRAGGMVLIVDDPPGTGTALASAARALVRAGVPGSRIAFVLSLFGPAGDLPWRLREWPAVVQPWDEWSIHRRLGAEPVRQALAGLVPDLEVREARPVGRPSAAGERGHLRARFDVRLADRRTGAEITRQVLVEGAGLGYLGRQGIAIARALPDHVPHVYGFADGLLYRDWLPASPAPVRAGTVAAYVDDRRRALPAPAGSTSGLGGRDPVWEVAAKVVAGQYGRLLSVPARPLLLEPLMRRLLTPAHPAVLDSKTDVRHWLPDPASGGQLRKVDFYQRSFGHLDLACYDPVFDLAGAAAGPPAPSFEAELREAYERLSGEQVDGERWLLYRLAQLWRAGRAGDLARPDVLRRSAAAVHDYLAALFLTDLVPPDGPLCAIDLDGVLECDQLGFPATSPTGMRALRALIAHGYRPVPVTGRSAPEVRDRCLTFGLAGGVAEYGAAIYHDGEFVDLRPRDSGDLLDRIRKELSGIPGVRVDPHYRYAVRASSDPGPLAAGLIRDIPELSGPDVRIIHGEDQTDITVAGMDKATGLSALAARLSASGCAFAIGDTRPDIPMLAGATLARAPRNARFGGAGTGIRRTRRAYQAGLSEAGGDLLGHRPGRCPACRPPAFTSRTRTVLALLDLRANGLASLPGGTAALAGSALRRR
jgi:hypothetical protein